MGSVAKRFACNELELTRAQSELSRATDKRLASARQIESQTNKIERLREEVRQLKVDKVSLNTRVQKLGTAPSVVKTETVVSSSDSSSGESPISSDEGSGSHRDSEDTSRRRTAKQSHPLGFREVRSRVKCFSGNKGEDDFQLWVEDYEEASEDYRWSDRDRARWFSWFVTGPAKLAWQRTLKQTDKTSWKNIVAIYKGQYGVHLDPRTAYQRCHELKYEQFGYAQGLLDAMRDYQRMAPTKLTDMRRWSPSYGTRHPWSCRRR